MSTTDKKREIIRSSEKIGIRKKFGENMNLTTADANIVKYSGLDDAQILGLFGLSEGDALDKIKEKYGARVAERAKIISSYWAGAKKGEVKEPIIFVIGGMPCSAKSTLSAYIANTCGLNICMGGDGFRAVLRHFIDPSNKPFFTSVYESWKSFGEFNNENVIRGFNAQANILNESIERLVVDRGIRDGEGMSVDFLHFLPSQWHKETLAHPGVIPFVLYVEDKDRWKDFMKRRVTDSHLKGGWERLAAQIDTYSIMRDYQIEDARRHGIPIIKTDDPAAAKEQMLDIAAKRIKALSATKDYQFSHPWLNKIHEERKG